MDGTNRTDKSAAWGPWSTLPAALGLLALLLNVQIGVAQNTNTTAPANRVLIANVFVVGTRTISTDKAMQYIYSKPNSEYSYARAQDDVSRLAASHLFKYIQVKTEATTDGRMNVIFVVQEHPSISGEVHYKHAKHVNVKDLEGITRIKRGIPLDKTLNQIACCEIQEHLRTIGYCFANVSLEEGFDERHDRVVFNITEGPKVRVRHVDFVDQTELATADQLRSQIDTNRAFLGTFSGSFNRAMIDNDVLKLAEYYKANGYFNVQIARELKFSDDFLFVDIVFHVREGFRFRVKEWSLEGAKNFPREQMSSLITLKPGDYYNDGVVTKDIAYLSAYIGWRGYQCDVKKIVTAIPDAPGMVRVQYLVETNPHAYVSSIIIIGK